MVVTGPRRGSRKWRPGVHMDADSEWALYGTVVVTWRGGERGSCTAADVRFDVPKRMWKWAVGGSLQTVTETLSPEMVDSGKDLG